MSGSPLKMPLRLFLPGLAIFLISGCSSLTDRMPEEPAAALKGATTYEFYSIYPVRFTEEQQMNAEQQEDAPEEDATEDVADEKIELFYDYRVLGKTTVSAQATRDTIYSALSKGVNESDGSVAGCFNPRHAIRLTYDGKQYDFVICFECHQIEWYVDGTEKKMILTDSSPADTLTGILSNARVELPDK